jgi:hypothetical protein
MENVRKAAKGVINAALNKAGTSTNDASRLPEKMDTQPPGTANLASIKISSSGGPPPAVSLGCLQTKQTKFQFEPKQDLFRLCFGLFCEIKN